MRGNTIIRRCVGRGTSAGLAAGAAVPTAPRHATTAVTASAAGLGWVLARGACLTRATGSARRGLAGSAVLHRRGARSRGGRAPAAPATDQDNHDEALDPLDLALAASRPSGRVPTYQDVEATPFNLDDIAAELREAEGGGYGADSGRAGSPDELDAQPDDSYDDYDVHHDGYARQHESEEGRQGHAGPRERSNPRKIWHRGDLVMYDDLHFGPDSDDVDDPFAGTDRERGFTGDDFGDDDELDQLTSGSRETRSKKRLKNILDDDALAELFSDPNVAAPGLLQGHRRDQKQDLKQRRKDSGQVQQQVQFRLGKMPDKAPAAPADDVDDDDVVNALTAAGTTVRQRRIGGAVQRTLTESLARGDFGMELVNLGLELSTVQMGRGMRYARVEWHSQGEPHDTWISEAIETQASTIRRVMANRMNLRYAPDFRFHKTDIRARETELDSLFEEARLEMEQYDKKNG